jgi:tetratricopeptide (TPR) repeat protein
MPMGQLLSTPPLELLTASDSDRPPMASVAQISERQYLDAHEVAGDQGYQATDGLLDIERKLVMVSRRAARFTAFAEARNIGGETVDQLRDQLSQLARSYVRDPLVSILGDLVEMQDTVFGLLEGKQKPAQTRDLYLLAGVISGLLAKASHDLGHPHDAMTQARTVYVCADNADHPGLRAFARAMQSLIAYWAGRPQESARYAVAGADIASGASGSLTAWLPALEARALALLGDFTGARAAIGRALTARENVRPDDLDSIGGLLTFSLAKQHYYAAGTFVHVEGEAVKGGQEASAALELYERGSAEDRSFSDEAGARSELALSRLQQGDLDGAYEAVTPVLELPPEMRIGGIVVSAMRVHGALRERPFVTSQVARDARDRIEEFCRRPIAALPR